MDELRHAKFPAKAILLNYFFKIHCNFAFDQIKVIFALIPEKQRSWKL